MQILESALAFAITMLVLSLTCSSFVEIVHRLLLMREAGLKYMLGQMFDKVLVKYIEPWATAETAQIQNVRGGKYAQGAYAAVRESFVLRMSANRAPMGVPPSETPATPTAAGLTPA